MAENGNRVVVTGLGAITGQGTTSEDLWQGVKAGKVAIREVEHMSTEGIRTKLGGEVQDYAKPEHEYDHPDDFRDRVFDFAIKASEEALENCGVQNEVPPDRWGVVIGTCNAGLLSGEEWYIRHKKGEDADPRLVLAMHPQAMAEAVASALDCKGPAVTIDTACAASANAVGYAADMIRSGQADAVLAGGGDAFSDILYAGFNSLESLSPKPAAPYSADREGLSLGEGGAMLVLMREDLAREKGAPVLAEVMGYGLSADGYHPTAPHPEGLGAARAIKDALKSAGVSPDEVQYVNSHGTGTPKNDPAETNATKKGLGEDAAYKTAVSSTKSMIGHLLGGAGAVEAIVTVKAIDDQVLPPTANYREKDPECDLDYVPNEARETSLDVAVSNNFAFGGANASVVLVKPGREQAPPAPDHDRVYVTGVAALTPAGTDPDALLEAFSSQKEALQQEDGVALGRVEFSAGDYLGPKERKRVDRLGLFAIIGAKLSLEDSGIEVSDENRDRIGAIVGTGVGPMESMEAFGAPVIEDGPAGANPGVFPNTVYNAAGGQVAIKVGILGPGSTICTGHASGAASIAYCYDLTRGDHADAVVSLSADALTPTVVEAYKSLGVLRSNGGDGGFGLSEAGVALVLERAGKAKDRGAKVYGEVAGYGIASDALGLGKIDAEGEGLERAMRTALERSGTDPGDIVAVLSSQTGLSVADEAEQKAISRVLGDDANVIAPKKLLGEPIGAGAAINAAIALKAWEKGSDAVPSGPVLVNSLSLGGTNFSLVLRPASD